MNLSDIRKRIDEVDDQLAKLFCERMHLVTLIAIAKWQQGLPLNDNLREQEICERAARQSGIEFAPYVRRFFSALFGISKDYQILRAPTEKSSDKG